ncbi:MAG: hypothetical protein LBK42_01825 [Propionibacteriaceae bacterium]|jgi:hypothetical protein|nr:hypothetical protein [Propionibacteriaceae bacterium]
MATWQDGPAYAPLERPFGFARPTKALSLDPPEAAPAAPPPPARPPLGFQAPSAPPLNQTPPPQAGGRDPKQAFDVATTTLTAGASAWGFAHSTVPATAPLPAVVAARPAAPVVPTPPPARPAAGPWTADQPWQSSYAPPPAVGANFPAPGTTGWFGAGPAQAPPPVTVPVNWQTWLESVGLPGVIVFGLGTLLGQLSPFCLVLGLACVHIMRYRRQLSRRITIGAWAGVLAAYVFGWATDLDFSLESLSRLACLVCLVGCSLVQWAALRAGDKPERTN